MKRLLLLFISLAPSALATSVQGATPYVFVRSIGTLGSGNGQFNGPRGVGVDSSGNVWVADYFNHRIQEFTSSGAFVQTFGSLGSTNGTFKNPTGVAVDS